MIFPSHRTLGSLLALGLATAGAAAQQGPPALVQLTNSMRSHDDAKVGPNGNLVAFRVGQSELGIVSVTTGIEVILHNSAGSNLTDYLWDPSGASLYFLEGNTIRGIARTGGAPRVIGSVNGINAALWAVDSAGTDLYGTRFDNSTGLTHVFRLATNGQSPPQDILSQQAVLDDVRIDPTDSFLLYRSWNGSPFTPVTYMRAPISGSPQTALYTSGANDNAQAADWVDAGQSFVLSMISPTVFNWHVGRVDSSGNLELLTDINYFHRRTTVPPAQDWVLVEMRSPDGLGITLGAIPPQGGGVVVLDGGQPLFNTFGNGQTDGLSVDSSGRVVAFGASSSMSSPKQIWVTELADEVRIFPRIVTGRTFVMEMGVATGELGGVAVSLGLNPLGPVSVPGIGGEFALDTTALATALVGVGAGGPISGSVQVPNDPSFVGFQLFFQGVRLGGGNDAFTRWGYMQVF